MTVASGIERPVKVGLGQSGFRELRLDALVQHGDDRADHLKVAEFLCGDVEEHVLSAGIVLAKALREIAHGRGQLAVRAAELLEQERGERRIGFADPYRVLQPLVPTLTVYFSRLLCMDIMFSWLVGT